MSLHSFTAASGDESAFTHYGQQMLEGVEGGMGVLEESFTIAQTNPDNPAFDLIGLTKLRNDPQFAGIDGSGFSVAVIDTGLDTRHPLIAPNYLAGYDFVDDDENPFDLNGHGTHVSGTVAAADENIGVAHDAGIISLRALDRNGGGDFADVEHALEWVLEHKDQYNITAVNMSLGLGFLNAELEEGDNPLLNQLVSIQSDIYRLEAAGVTVVSAAGNSYRADPGTGNLAFPAISSTLAVGAVWQDSSLPSAAWGDGSIDYTTGADRVTSFSQRLDQENMIFAPGALISSTVLGRRIGESAGTSQAAPHVAGMVALLQEAAVQFGDRQLTPAEVSQILRTTGDLIFDGDDEDDNLPNTNVIYVRANIYNAVSEVKNRFAPAPASSTDLNATFAQATKVSRLDGSSINLVRGSIGKDNYHTPEQDVDLYRFFVSSAGMVEIETRSDPANPADFDSYLRLFNASGNLIAANDDINLESGNTFSQIARNLERGTYYVGVSASANSSYNPRVGGSGISGDTGNYALKLSLNDRDPDGWIHSATEISLDRDTESVILADRIGTDGEKLIGTGDVDFFRIVAPDNGILLIDIDTPYETDFVDSFLRLYNEDGSEIIAESDDNFALDVNDERVEYTSRRTSSLVREDIAQTEFTSGFFDAAGNYVPGNYGHQTDSFVSARVTPGAVYYLGVSDWRNQNYALNHLSDRSTRGTGGNYELTTSFVYSDRSGSIDNATFINGLPRGQHIHEIGRDRGLNGEIHTVGNQDVDFYLFNSDTSGILELNVNSIADDPLDSTVTLYDRRGRQLAFSNGRRNNSQLRYSITANTRYYAAITGAGNQDFDPSISVSGSGGDTGKYRFKGRVLSSLTAGEELVGNDINIAVDLGIEENHNLLFNQETASSLDNQNSKIASNDFKDKPEQGFYTAVQGQYLNSDRPDQYNPINESFFLAAESTEPLDGAKPVYRFLNLDTGEHLDTIFESEQDFITNNLSNYSSQGVAYYGYENKQVDTVAIYRLYNPQSDTHLLVSSAAERDELLHNSASYQLEGNDGVAFYLANSDS
ncbi:MAG: S8 family serine peptidase [Cyanobacteria bacterium J06631_2]